jgi:hypothetical protein
VGGIKGGKNAFWGKKNDFMESEVHIWIVVI